MPAFFGLSVVWATDAPYASALADVIDPWDQNPLVERLETNRVFHLAEAHVQTTHAALWQQRAERRRLVLQRLLDSRAFALAERLSRLRHRAGIATEMSIVSKDEIRKALED